MKYENVVSGKFKSRPNRFIAHIEIDGKEEICHVMNTGRMKELLLPDAEVFLCPAKNPERKTKFDLIGVRRNVTKSARVLGHSAKVSFFIWITSLSFSILIITH
ncbi:MAG: hypothetical protein IKU42_02890 [Oscillospiraceae bacterium]|nr:hypothetical protein [Oscillospiraceae bacterium]